MKVLVIRFSSIGDIVLTTPVVRCLKAQRPDISIHYLTKSAYAALLSVNPNIDAVHTLGNSLGETIHRLKDEKFDLVIDLHHNLRTSLVKLRLGVPSRSFNKLNFAKWLLVKFKINILPKVHIVDRYLDTVRSLGVINDGLGLDYFFSGNYPVGALVPKSCEQGFVAVVIGGQHATKRLPADKIIDLCDQLVLPVILLGGKEDRSTGELIESKARAAINRCGQLTLDESAWIVKHATHVFTHDTGLMHIAAALQKPITSIWGNTVPAFGMTPYRTSLSLIAELPGLSCRPCSKIGHEKCPLGHFKCMRDLDMAAIAYFPVTSQSEL